ncbi:unnamed protein product [Rotaria socialis]|uniref:Ig-like domain-containing protein n=1 Tax=Rotaria socialis TaxID=392032 RepID=A0A817SEH0_9BILA|nr:unnamed protein product [Rotaria socialis]
MASLLEQLPPFGDNNDIENNIPKSFLNVLQELYHDGRLTSWKVRGQGDVLSVRLTWLDPNHRNACIKAKARQHLADLDEIEEDPDCETFPTGSVVSYVTYDKNVKRELNEYSTRLSLLVDKLQADLAERNVQNSHYSLRGKSKEGLKAHQQQIATEICRARVAISGPLRPVLQVLYALQTILISIPSVATIITLYILLFQRTYSSSKPLNSILDHTGSNPKSNSTHEGDLHNLLVQETEKVLQTNLQNFQKALTTPNSSINTNNFDQKLAQNIFDKCVSKEIFQELPEVIETSAPTLKSQRQSSNTSSLTSLTKPSTFPPTWSNTSPRTSTTSWEIKSRNDNIRKIRVPKGSIVNEQDDTEKVDENREQIIHSTSRTQPTTATESIELANGLRLDLSSLDGEISNSKSNRHSHDSDFEAINRSIARVGEWQTNFTLVESKTSSHSGEETPLHVLGASHSGEETPRSTRGSVFLTIPISDNKYSSPRVGDKPLEDLADDDLYANESSSSYPIPINTATIGEQSQFSDNDSANIRKFFPLPANLLLQNHSSCSFRRPSYTYESDNESITSSIPSLTEMKTSVDEEKFRMDPNITDPKFVVRPKDTTARCGETAKFKVKVAGTAPVDVFWFRFGTDDEIVNDEKYQLSHDDTFHYLKIYSTNKDDQGAYLCVIANDKAQNVDMIKLFVKDNKRSFNPPQIIQEYSDADVNEGSSLTLKCKLDLGYPKARILWYKENTLIQPNGHYKLYYYGNGQHALHVDEATIEEDNGTFTCLALNAAGRVQITADVFVHEKEVIDIPRDSPKVKHHDRVLKNKKPSNEIATMNHNDDEAPTISRSISPLQRSAVSDNEEHDNAKRFMDKFKNDRSSKLLENWRNLYEASVNSLQSDDDEPNAIMPQPFYLNKQSSIENPLKENPRSPILLPQSDSNPGKSKWAIRLPDLLNTTVGPDRQKRDSTRRHTTNIVLDQEQQQQSAFIPQNKAINPLSQSLSATPMSNNVDDDRPSSPLVKHLRQKFDRMTANNLINEQNKLQSQSQTGLSKIHRVASLTCRGLTANSGDRSVQKPRPMLPVQLSNQTDSTKKSSNRSASSDNKTTIDNDRHQRGKTSPPISYRKHSHSSRSTTSVVKDIIGGSGGGGGGGGATLVYDSLIQDNNTLHITIPLLQNDYYPNHHHQQQRKEHVRVEQTAQSLKTNLINKTNTNTNLLILTGRQLQSNSSHNTKPINTKIQNNPTISDDDETKNQQNSLSTKDSLNRSTSMSDNFSISAKHVQHQSNGTSLDSNLQMSSDPLAIPVGRKSVLARAELWDRRISTNDTETNIQLTTYDIEQWSTEFEKIQNQIK